MTEVAIAMVGRNGSGKSAIMIQIMNNHFVEEYGERTRGKSVLEKRSRFVFFLFSLDPEIEDSYRRWLTVDYRDVLIDLLDTNSAQETSTCEPRREFHRRTDGILGVCDITDEATFTALPPLVRDVEHVRGHKLPKVIMGNKVDLVAEDSTQRVLSREAMEAASSVLDYCEYYEISAKTREGLFEALYALIRRVFLARGDAPVKGGGSGRIKCSLQ